MHQITQSLGADTGQSHQHDGIIHVMIRDVVSVGRLGEQSIALVHVDTKNQGIRFGGLVNCHARHQRARDFQRRSAVARTLFHAGKRGCDLPHHIKCNFAGHDLAK